MISYCGFNIISLFLVCSFCSFLGVVALLWFDILWSSMLGRHTEHVAQGARRSRSVLWTHRLPVQRNCDVKDCHFPSLVTSVSFTFQTAVFVLECVFCFVLWYNRVTLVLQYLFPFHFLSCNVCFIWVRASYVFHVSDSEASRAVFTFEVLPRFVGWKHPFILVLLVSFVHYSIGGQKISLNVKSYQLPHEKKKHYFSQSYKTWFFFLKKI